MPDKPRSQLSRRDALRMGLGAGVAVTLDWRTLLAEIASQPGTLIERAIPSSGEKLPIVGIGTAIQYDVGTDAEKRTPLRDVLKRFPELGGRVIDTAPSYGSAESVVGDLLSELRNRDRYFVATKVSARGGRGSGGGGGAGGAASPQVVDAAVAQMNESMRKLRTERVDLMQVHNLSSVDQLVPLLLEWKAAKKIRYAGVTTSSEQQYGNLERVMGAYPLDFIQIDYAIDNREAAQRILPLALERKMAVLINLPFGRNRLFQKVAGKPLPPFAAEIDCTSWAQYFLKYLVSNPSVTCVIPGTEKVEYVVDNLGAARGRLPDAAMRTRMEQYFDAL
jgi:aryl-alcohol dehydrogenase-like predicted oxidoreductase